MDRPVFYDASGRRNRLATRVFLAGLLLLAVTALSFAATLVEVPIPGPLSLSMERPQPRPLSQQVNRTIAKIKSWLPGGSTAARQRINQLKIGFYAPWDDASGASLAAHIGELDWL